MSSFYSNIYNEKERIQGLTIKENIVFIGAVFIENFVDACLFCILKYISHTVRYYYMSYFLQLLMTESEKLNNENSL